MGYVALKAYSGQYLGVREDGLLAAVKPTVTPAEIFEWVQLTNQAIALRSIVTGRYITAPGPGQPLTTVTQAEPGPQETFRTTRTGNLLSLTTHDGQAVSAKDRGEVVADHAVEQFQVAPMDDLLAEARTMRCCCGLPQHGHGTAGAPYDLAGVFNVTWNRQTHSQIVDNAFDLVHRHNTIDGGATLMGLWADPTFRSAVHAGLVDADDFWKPEYTGFLYAKHFYDPDTRTNYLGYTTGTAMTEGLLYFQESTNLLAPLLPLLARGEALSPARAQPLGYKLGLALHYFTDLSQPMHAANFPNVFASGLLHDWRHSGFELYTENYRERFQGDLSAVERHEIDPAALGFACPADILQRVATDAKRIFTDTVEPAAAAKLQWVAGPEGAEAVFDNTWGQEADPALKEALPKGQKLTAAFLLYWAAHAA